MENIKEGLNRMENWLNEWRKKQSSFQNKDITRPSVSMSPASSPKAAYNHDNWEIHNPSGFFLS